MNGLTSGSLIGQRYEIKGLYRTGSLHTYWNALDTTLGRPVVIKFLKEAAKYSIDGIDHAEIFRRDASLLAQLEHPNILPIYDIGEHADELYVVTRDISGLSLFDTLRHNTWSIAATNQFAQRISAAIDYIHSQNIVHGDITPNNVLIGYQAQPYLANFTMTAMREEFAKNNLPAAVGTMRFLSPEILAGSEATPLSDIYSFGAILFYCFTYHLPPKTEDYVVLPSIHDYRPELPIGIDVILKRLTQKDPENRYQTASEAVEDLSRVFYSGQSNVEGKIFISYARKDSDYVHKLALELRNIGLDIWIDQDIEPGSNWDDSIESALNECDMMLLITTEASMSSEYVTHEWSYFMGAGKPVYPFIPQAPIPDNIHPRLTRVQYVVGTDDLLNNISRIIDILAQGTPLKIADDK